MKAIWRYPWTVAACNVLLVMVLYSLLRVGCYAVNTDMFPDVDGAHLWEILCGGVRFDLTAVLYLSSLYIIGMLLPIPARWRNNAVYQRVLAWLFIVPNAIGIVVNTIDIVYMRFTDRRTTCTFFTEFANDNNLLRIAWQGITEYWYVTLMGVAALAVLFFCTRKRADASCERIWVYYVRETLLFAVTVYMCVIGIRGGFGRYTRPITLSNAMLYANTPRESALVLNTPFALMRSTEGRTYTDPHYFEPEEMAHIMTPIHESEATPDRESQMNVVVIILESFSTEYIGFYNQEATDYEGYTPFLDSLLAQSVTWQQSFASGRKSIDAMPSVLSSIPMLIDPYVVTPYSTNAVSSIADCLGREGYTTAFFHGAPNGSMGFQAYARSAGFQHYYGMDEYPEARRDYDGTWAIWDEPFLQYYAQAMSDMKEPFMTAVFTASSHHPFRVPESYLDTFPEGSLPIHKCIGYSDHALRRFFAFAKTQPWFEHTLFVLTADHTNQLTRPEYTNAAGLYRVPIAFYYPDSLPASQRSDVISQTDIMPSVLNYLGYNKPYFAFGEDALMHSKAHNYAVCYNYPVFQIMGDSLLVQFDGEQIVGVYAYRTDRTLKENIAARVEPQRIEPMGAYLKAYIQQYIHRMIHDELRIEK